MQSTWSTGRLFYLNILCPNWEKEPKYCGHLILLPFSLGKVPLYQQIGFLETLRDIIHTRKNITFISRETIQYAHGSLNTDPLRKNWYFSFKAGYRRSSAPFLYADLFCNGWTGRVGFCLGASVFKSPNQVSPSSKDVNLMILSLWLPSAYLWPSAFSGPPQVLQPLWP